MSTKNIIHILLLCLCEMVYASSICADEIGQLQERIKSLEVENLKIQASQQQFQEEMRTNLNNGALAQELALDLEQQIRNAMHISGYADVEMLRTEKNSYLRLHHFSLFFRKKISEKWQLSSEIEYEDAPIFEANNDSQEVLDGGNNPVEITTLEAASGKILLETMSIDYRWRPTVNLRLGRFFTPAGIWSLDHYPPFVTTQERPLHIRKIFPQLVDGLGVYGTRKFSSAFINYDVYTGNGEGNQGGAGDNDHHKALGFKAELELDWLDLFRVGFSGYVDTVDANPDRFPGKKALGIHLKSEWQWLNIQAEFARAYYSTGIVPGYRTDAFYGFYVQAALKFGKTIIGIRPDKFTDYKVGDNNLSKTRRTLFANYRLEPDILLKLEYHQDRFNSKLEDLLIGSITVNLGN